MPGACVTIEAISTEDWFVLAIAGAVSGGNAAISGAVLVVVANQGGSRPADARAASAAALVDAVGDMTVHARKGVDAKLSSGNLAISTSGAGVGAAVTVVVRDNAVAATIAGGADIRARGDLHVHAEQTGDYLLLAVGGAGGNSVGVGGSVTVNVLTDTTSASIGSGAKVNCVGVSCANAGRDPHAGRRRRGIRRAPPCWPSPACWPSAALRASASGSTSRCWTRRHRPRSEAARS